MFFFEKNIKIYHSCGIISFCVNRKDGKFAILQKINKHFWT